MNIMRCALWCAVTAALVGYPIGASGAVPETAGIGLGLEKSAEGLVVRRILPSSPASVGRSVAVGDRILSVAQGNQPAVEVQGMKLEEVVSLIRGPQGSTVWLSIVPEGKDASQARSVSFVRGELKQLARWGDGLKLAPGTKAPDIRLVRLADARAEQLADHAGKIVVLEFWSISCGPCQKLMANLQNYPAQHPHWKDQVMLIGVDVDEEQDPASKHVQAQGWDKTHNVWVGTDALKAYHVDHLPSIYVIDRDGKIAAADVDEDIPTVVNRLLERK